MTLLLIVGMLLPAGAGAEEAQNMIEECELTVNGKNTYGQYVLWDGDFATDYRLAANRYMDVDAGEKRITGVFVQFLKESQPLTVQIEQDGEYVTVGEISGKYLSEYV